MSDALTPREVIARALATWFGKPWPRRKSNRETYLGGADIVPSALKDNGMAVAPVEPTLEMLHTCQAVRQGFVTARCSHKPKRRGR